MNATVFSDVRTYLCEEISYAYLEAWCHRYRRLFGTVNFVTSSSINPATVCLAASEYISKAGGLLSFLSLAVIEAGLEDQMIL